MNAIAIIPQDTPDSLFVGKIPQSPEEQDMLFNAMNQPDGKLADHINEELEVVNVFVQNIQVDNTDDKTAEAEPKVNLPRTVLILSNGQSFGCASRGIYSALEKLFAIYGTPADWTNPMIMKLRQVTTKRGSMLTLELINSNGNTAKF